MFGWPNDATLLFLAAAFCSACYLVICGRPGSSWLKSVLKTASVALLALIAFKLSDMLLLAVGLTACAVGDFFLSRKGTEEFVSGIGAFAFGHLSYTALFFLQPSADFLRISDGWPLTLALVLLGLVMIFLLFRTAGKLRWATIIYVPVIMSMGVMAMILPPVGARHFGHLIIINQVVVFAHTVMHRVKPLARLVRLRAMCQVPARGQIHAQNRVARLDQRSKHALVGL